MFKKTFQTVNTKQNEGKTTPKVICTVFGTQHRLLDFNLASIVAEPKPLRPTKFEDQEAKTTNFLFIFEKYLPFLPVVLLLPHTIISSAYGDPCGFLHEIMALL